MSHSDIDAMQPGPELDALVAEKVMGWEKNDQGMWVMSRSTENGWKQTINIAASQWRPSTSIKVAWEVMEKMRHLGLYPGVGVDGDRWEAWVFDTEPVQGDFSAPKVKATAPIAPLAICKAALKAVQNDR